MVSQFFIASKLKYFWLPLQLLFGWVHRQSKISVHGDFSLNLETDGNHLVRSVEYGGQHISSNPHLNIIVACPICDPQADRQTMLLMLGNICHNRRIADAFCAAAYKGESSIERQYVHLLSNTSDSLFLNNCICKLCWTSRDFSAISELLIESLSHTIRTDRRTDGVMHNMVSYERAA